MSENRIARHLSKYLAQVTLDLIKIENMQCKTSKNKLGQQNINIVLSKKTANKNNLNGFWKKNCIILY